jgi:hypothetical protein
MSKEKNDDKVKIISLTEAARKRGSSIEEILLDAIKGKAKLFVILGGWAQQDVHSGELSYTEPGQLQEIDKDALTNLLTLGKKDLKGNVDIYSDDPDFEKASQISVRQYKDNKEITKESLVMIDDGESEPTLKTFAEMEGLRWDEIEITLTDKAIIINTARGETIKASSGEFGLINKNNGRPNKIYELLTAFSAKQQVSDNRKMTVTRARDLLKKNFGIAKTPIEKQGKYYQPLFKISVVDYKKSRSEGKQYPLGRMPLSTPNTTDALDDYKIGSSRDYDLEGDSTDDWLANNDPDDPDYSE